MPVRVLVVDDEPAIRELLAEYLRGRGMDVAVVPDGEQGRDAIGREPPDLVLTDLKLPGIDGIEVLRAAASGGVPAVLMTGFGTVETAVDAYAAGARDYVLKPFRLRDLYAALEQALADAGRDRRRAWAEQAFALTVAAHEAAEPEQADALVARLVELVRALPGAEHAALRSETTGGGKPLGGRRWIDAPPVPEARALIAAVHAALLRLGR